MQGQAEARGAGQHGRRGRDGPGEGQGGNGGDSAIKGWMSFADIATMTGIPLADFGVEWGVPTADSTCR